MLLVGVALVAVVAIVAAILVSSGGGKSSGGEVFLEATENPGTNPFTQTVAAPLPTSTVRRSTTTTRPRSTTTARPGQVSFTSLHGSTPGLYGGTQNNSTCDANQLVSFLQANPDKAKAWASVFGGKPADIPGFVRTLTPVLLDRDTRVTNHGYKNGQATTLQSVLQAGTAVMVDQFGTPRVKCNCGNPLTEPVALTTTPVYQGPKWPEFDPSTVVIVQQNVKVNVFVLNDVVTGDRFTRPVGSDGSDDQTLPPDQACDLFPDDPACTTPSTTTTTRPGEPELGTGDVQVTLRWNSTADLDLAVTDPFGETVAYDNRAVSSGGQLDVDSNGSCTNTTSTPVENVFWPGGQSPDGDYVIVVSYFDTCNDEGPQTFTLDVTMGSRAVNVVEASTTGQLRQMELQSPQSTSATLQPGESKSYKVSKVASGGATTSTTTTTTPQPEATSSESITTTTLSCAEQFPDDYMQRTLCEHNPSE